MNTGSTTNTPIVEQAIATMIGDGREIGLQVCAYLDGRLAVDCWGGAMDAGSDRMVDGDTLFNVYSVTKAVAATALHIQASRGLIDYEARVVDYWPEYAANGKEATTVRHILTHRAGVPQMPEAVTPELMCDWEWMTREIANLTPIAPPGEKALYLSMTFGWLVGELVRRTDPAHRHIGQFVREEIALPLNAPDLWVGLPDSALERVAVLTNAAPNDPAMLPPLYTASMPANVDLIPEVFELPDVRRAPVAAVGGVFSARSCARFWAMLAQGGELDGVCILPEDLVSGFSTPRADPGEPDPVMFGRPLPLGIGGFWLGTGESADAPVRFPKAIHHPGAGNSLGFADPTSGLAFAFTHNRMQAPQTDADNTVLILANAVREQLGLN